MKGKTWASIVIKHNYSSALRERVMHWSAASDYDILASEVDVFRDVSSKYFHHQTFISLQIRVLIYVI